MSPDGAAPLYDRIGGEPALVAFIDRLYEEMANDPHVARIWRLHPPNIAELVAFLERLRRRTAALSATLRAALHARGAPALPYWSGRAGHGPRMRAHRSLQPSRTPRPAVGWHSIGLCVTLIETSNWRSLSFQRSCAKSSCVFRALKAHNDHDYHTD